VRVVRAVLVLQLVGIAAFGALVAARAFIWAPIDERAHYAYLEEVATDHRLPLLDDLVSPDVQAVTDRTYPRPSPNDPRDVGIAGRVTEAFQPPLYYLVAAPLYHLGDDPTRRVHLLRGFDLSLLLIGAALVLVAARRLQPEGWELPACVALSVVAWPGVVMRSLTVANTALELPLVMLFLLACLRARRRDEGWAVVAAGTLLGACLLTRLTLAVLAPLLLVLAWQHVRGRPAGRRRVASALAALLAPAVLLAPWVASNLHRYGAATATGAAFDQQRAFFGNPSYGIDDLPRLNGKLLSGALPQEWPLGGEPAPIKVAAVTVLVLLFAVTLASLARRPGLAGQPAALLAVAPALGWLVLNLTTVRDDYDVFFPRLLYATLIPATLVAAGWWRASFGASRTTAVAVLLAGLVLALQVTTAARHLL